MTLNCDPLIYDVPNITEYVLMNLGERCHPPSIVIPTLLIYALLLLLGVAGNACTCVVILADRSMHNPTNFYLFSLAVSDIIILILGLPMELHGVMGESYPYDFGPLVCKLRAFLIEFTSYASVTVIFSFSVERWIAICFPLRAKLFSTLGRALCIILFAWTLSFACAMPMAFVVTINRIPLPEWADVHIKQLVSPDGLTVERTEYCAMDATLPQMQKLLIYFAFFAFFLIPAVVMTLMYSHIAYRLRSADKLLTKDKDTKDMKPTKSSKSRRSVIKVLVSVVVTFFLFWLPFHLQRLLSIYMNDQSENHVSENIQYISTCLFYISGYCYYSNSVCNPILYNLLSENYRRAFCRTILGDRAARKLLPKMSTDRSAAMQNRKNSRYNGEASFAVMSHSKRSSLQPSMQGLEPYSSNYTSPPSITDSNQSKKGTKLSQSRANSLTPSSATRPLLALSSSIAVH